MSARSNIILIGMPGSGKSTVGVLLARAMSHDFVDTDLLIQSAEGRSLQDIVNAQGYLALRAIEERVLLQLNVRNHVIATGGSAVYSDCAMSHLKRDGIAVFLDVPLAELKRRLGDFSRRGVAKRPLQSFAELYEERRALYLKYADLHISCDALGHEETRAAVARQLLGDGGPGGEVA